ncbi:glycosyl transferase family 1, partial [Salmonella enterica subsp. enterica serovar Typhimurium]|nr:glycosyl transferase family 1 [Salmonella enterica subsp. enterica serovar Typhimurium]
MRLHVKKSLYLLVPDQRPFVGASWPHKNIHSFIKNKKVWSDSYNLIIVCGR